MACSLTALEDKEHIAWGGARKRWGFETRLVGSSENEGYEVPKTQTPIIFLVNLGMPAQNFEPRACLVHNILVGEVSRHLSKRIAAFLSGVRKNK